MEMQTMLEKMKIEKEKTEELLKEKDEILRKKEEELETRDAEQEKLKVELKKLQKTKEFKPNMQDDARSYIQESTKEGSWDSGFRKRKLGGDGKKTSYWFDGNDIQGYKIYREVNEISKKNAGSDLSCLSWETEATNLDESRCKILICVCASTL
ncbi:unnamed protein product [Arabidopsis arenosa]|uniref:Uncharacterized protein n=1 Tax=Arabidopsis arenosa TaxID=38785 RepID=A0A8S2ACL4_ARAAE|nr:unnamed protein product [Arabidopsis arenosa]